MPEVENPYAPKNVRVSAGPVFPTARLRRLCVDDAQLARLGAAWDGWGVEARLEFAQSLSVQTDEQVLGWLAEEPKREEPKPAAKSKQPRPKAPSGG